MDNTFERISIEEHHGLKIIFINFSGMREKEMIELEQRARKLIVEKRYPFLADFTQTYVTPNFMNYAKLLPESAKGIKGAVLGVDSIKEWILKGLVYLQGANYKSFDSKEKAIQFLTDESGLT